MQFSFSNASAVDVAEPTAQARNGNVTAAAHKSLHAIISKTSSDQPTYLKADQTEAKQTDAAELTQAEPLTVVKQTIDDLEAQGLLMLFDRHDQVAKRLTGDLIAAGVLPEGILQEGEPIAEPVSTNLKHAKEPDEERTAPFVDQLSAFL